jgi:hypothetical protein
MRTPEESPYLLHAIVECLGTLTDALDYAVEIGHFYGEEIQHAVTDVNQAVQSLTIVEGDRFRRMLERARKELEREI